MTDMVSDPHSFYADPDPAFTKYMLELDPDHDPDPKAQFLLLKRNSKLFRGFFFDIKPF